MKNRQVIYLLVFLGFSITLKAGEINNLGTTKLTPHSPLDGWRLGVGLGYAFYLGDQMDYTLTRHYGDFHELRPNLTIGGFKQLNQDKEWGLVMKFGSFQTLKSSNTQGIQCNYQELQSIWHRTLNDNIDLNQKRVTVNVQYGIGLTYFKSMYFAVNPNFLTITEKLSTVGYGYEDRSDFKGKKYVDIPNKKLAVIGNLGISLGFKISKTVNLYWENSIQVSSSSKMSGNLVKTAKIPPDGYFYSGISVYMRFGVGGGRLGCPSLQYYSPFR